MQVETGAMWEYGNVRSQQPNPVVHTQGYPGHGPTHIDLKYKVIRFIAYGFHAAFVHRPLQLNEIFVSDTNSTRLETAWWYAC